MDRLNLHILYSDAGQCGYILNYFSSSPRIMMSLLKDID